MDGSRGNLDTSNAERLVWMMKCPKVVAESIQAHVASGADGPSAKIVLAVDPLDPDSDCQFTLELAENEKSDVPKVYSLNMFKDIASLAVISETDQGKLALNGKVGYKFDIKPHPETIEDYGRFFRVRTTKSMLKNRQLRVIDRDCGQYMLPKPRILSFRGSKDKKSLKVPKLKRERGDPSQVEITLFTLFERQPRWSIRQLLQETNQPEKYLTGIVKKLCTRVDGKYELKEEYRRQKGETNAANKKKPRVD